MKLIQKQFYREKGIRYADVLATTQGIVLDSFPKSSLFHHFQGLTASDEVDANLKYFQGYSKKILLDYVVEYPVLPAFSRKTSFQIRDAIRDFKIKNRQRWEVVVSPWVTNQDPETLIVLNYGYLDQIYKFQEVPMANYVQWKATVETLWKNVARISKVSNRNHYVFIRLPKLIVGFSILEQFINGDKDYRFNQVFGLHDENVFYQLDLWKWLSVEHRSQSLMSAVEEDQFSKVNIVVEGVTGRKTLINLGYLNSWIKGQKNQTEFTSVVQHEVNYIQKLFLKLCMSLNAVNEPEEFEVPTEVSPSDSSSGINENEETDEEISLSESEKDTQAPSSLTKETTQSLVKPIDPEKDIDLHIPKFSQELSNEIEKDILALDQLTLKHLQASDLKLQDTQPSATPEKTSEEIKQEIYKQETPEELLSKRLDKDAEYNLVTAADYRKLKESSKSYLDSKDPYGTNKTRLEAMRIVPEDIIISKDSEQISISDAVQDESMAKSVLRQIDKQYVDKVYKKDVLKAIHAVQASGVIIKNHEIDTEHSVLGTYERHTLELKPVDGAPSTISFTFPKIEDDGTFYANGSKYIMRRQRVD